MYITSPTLKNGKTVVRLVVSIRQKGKKNPSSKTIKTIGQSNDPKEIEHFKSIAQPIINDYNNKLITIPDLSENNKINIYDLVGKKRFNKGFEDVFGFVYDKLGFSKLLTNARNINTINDVLKYVVLMRAYDPSSKTKTSKILEEYFNKDISLRRILFMMDRISDDFENTKNMVFESLFAIKNSVNLLLFDVTTLYFESESVDILRNFGRSKDGKHGEVQILLAVLSDQQGMPLNYEVFPENVAETKTFAKVLSAFLENHPVEKISVVADRGMFSESNLSYLDDLNNKSNNIIVEYIVSSTLKKFPNILKDDIFSFKQKIIEKREYNKNHGIIDVSSMVNFHEIRYNQRRVIVSFSEKHRIRDEHKREKILEKLKKITNKNGIISDHYTKKKTGISRYIKKDGSKKAQSYCVDNDKIKADAKWDGLYGICTNTELNPQTIFANYRRLWKIEEFFRIDKHALEMRPVFHWTPKRIKSHIFICFLSYAVLRYTDSILKNAGVEYSLETIIKTLKNVETYIIRDTKKLTEDSSSYGVPRELSEEAIAIYKAMNIKYSTRPYKI